MKKLTLIAFGILIISKVFAQSQNPPNTEWMQIKTEHLKVIFPAEIEDEAQRAANLVEYLYKYETKTLKSQPKKLPLLLFNQSTVANGFAGLRPRRSVWFTTPSQYASDLGNTDWLSLLASHEFRHIVQYSKSNHYMTKVLSILFGQTGLLAGEYSIPFWFFEGDAVCTETAFSNLGRGRIAQFEMPIRTLLLNDKTYSYDKAKFRSYKNYYPSHYNLGWLMTSYARYKYGADIWDKVLTNTSKISLWPYAFSVSLKKYTGLNEKNLYKEAMQFLKEKWTLETKDKKYTKALKINQAKKKVWTKYTEAAYLSDGNILAKKADLKEITWFYIIQPDGTEKKLFPTDAGMVSVAGTKAVWERHIPDARYGYRDYSDIMILNVKTKTNNEKIRQVDTVKKIEKYKVTQKRLTFKQKYFSPALSPNAKQIAVAEYTSEMKSALIIIDAETGKEIKRFPNKLNDVIRTPAWSEDGKFITYTSSSQKGTALNILDLKTEKVKTVIPYTYENIGRPVFYKNYILYNSPFSGTGNIFAVDTKTKRRYQITSRKYGAYNPKVQGEKLLFSDYSVEGYDIAEMTLTPNLWKDITDIDFRYRFKLAEKVKSQEQGRNILNPDLIYPMKYEVTKYWKFKDAINLHSWMFGASFTTPDSLDKPGLAVTDFVTDVNASIYTGNYLNTIFGVAGVGYNLQEKTTSYYASMRVSKFYPIFDVTGSYGQRYLNYGEEFGGEDRWTEKRLAFSATIPLNFSRGVYSRGADLKVNYSFVQMEDKSSARYITQSTEGNFATMSYTASAYNFREKSLRDMYPKFGQFLYLTYKHTPFNTNIVGSQFSAYASMYFPGLFSNNSLNIKGGFEQQREFANQTDYYWFSTPQSFPRGHGLELFDQIIKGSVDYRFPIWYPELNLGTILYFKRLRGGLFYDYAQTKLGGTGKIYQSAGVELHLMFYAFRLALPLEIGFRGSYLFDNNNTFYPEIVFAGINF